jgi:hypothetical protein
VALHTMAVMDLTSVQRRTLEDLIRREPPPALDQGLPERVRASLEAALADAGVAPDGGPPIWLGKGRLNDFRRCEGLFQATLLREGPPFRHSTRTAAGALFHRAIEVDVASERRFDPGSVCERAARRLAEEDGSFERYWLGVDELERAELATEAERHLVLFRDSFPPMPRRWAPVAELTVRVRLAGGRVVLSGSPDLVMGRTRRLVIDFKSGSARPEHPEDMRFYALILLLRTGLSPYRVATFFLDSGEWQAEDVTEATLRHAADRVLDAAAGAARLDGRSPVLTPGAHCGWCPRATGCPSAEGAA